MTLEKIIECIHDVDVIILEGFKGNKISHKIGLRRGNYELPEPAKEYIAVISDRDFKCNVPVFDINDYYGFAEWLINDIRLLQLS